MSGPRTLALRRVGDQGQRVLLVHGWMMSSAVFDRLLEGWPADGRQLALPDLAGAGGSSGLGGGFTLDEHLADLIGVLDDLGWEDAAVVGHSMGGQLAQLLASRYPQRVSALALINPVPVGGLGLPEPAARMFGASATERSLQPQILAAATRQLVEADLRALTECAAGVESQAITDGLEAWTRGAPTLVSGSIPWCAHVLATDDPFLTPALLHDQVVTPIGHASLTYVRGPGHYPLVERPLATAAWLEAVL